MMGTFPIPGTNSVSIPPSSALLELPSSSSSSSAVSVATDAGAIAGTGVTTAPTATTAADITAQLTNVTESINTPPGAESPELIKVLRSEGSTSKLPTAMSSGFYRSGVSLSGSRQPELPQKRAEQQEQKWQKWSPSQGQGQQGQQWYQQGQGQGRGQQWYLSQGQGQQWHPSQGQQGQQGQQWYQQQGQGRGQPLVKPYTIQKRAITASTSTPIMGSIGIAATAPKSDSPTYRMSSLICNLDTTTRGLIHCSDYKDYFTLEQPANPANSADLHNRPWSTGSSSPAGHGANTGSSPATAIVKKRAATTQGVGYQSGSIGTPAAPTGDVSALAVDPQGLFRRPQPYGGQSQPQAQAWPQSQDQAQKAQVYKRQATGAAAAAAADATNQAAVASIVAANQANAIAAAIHRQHGLGLGSTSSSGNVDLDNLSKWSGSGYTGGSEGGDWYGKGGSTGYGKAGGGGKKWKRKDFDEGNLSNWPGAGAGPSYGGRDEWSHYGKGNKKWGKRVDLDEGNLSKWSGGGSGYSDDWSHYGKGGKKWSKRQVLGATVNGQGGYGRGGNTGAIPVPIDVGLVWDGNSVNLVPPPSSRGVGGPGGPVPGAGGIPADVTVVGGDSPAIPVPINVNALVYPDGQMQIFPSASAN
ncbi:hypothetical protein BG015_009427 [Linnemannia schmuckeri]|uniref:Uncharacterized protein n=1 Tax=Linnemannia schmuckeri TaxID=64567 RepID=A0A9P5S832_9FUNG|nr:hypothetical protein BG015_009427 [Linnemannia schmuckeri]